MSRKLPLLAALSAVLFFTSLAAERVALARINGSTTLTTVTQPDVWCAGGTNQGTSNAATEVCLTYGGNFLPTTSAVQSLGSTSLRWSDVETVNLNSGGGSLSVGGLFTASAFLTLPPITTTAVAALSAKPVGTLALVTSSNSVTPGICVSTANAVGSFVWMSTSTTANIGTVCQ